MTRLSSLSIKTQMLLLIFVMSLAPLGIIFYSAVQEHNFDDLNALLTAERLSNEVGNQQQVLLSGAEQLLSSLAYVPCIQQRDVNAAHALLAELTRKNPNVSNILMADTNGLVWAAALPLPSRVMVNDQRYFKQAIKTGEFSSGEYSMERVLNRPAIGFGYPIRDSRGQIGNVAIVTFTLDGYNHLLKVKKMPANTSLVLTDHRGDILFDAKKRNFIGMKDKEDIAGRIASGPDKGTFEATGITGKQRYFAYQKLRLGNEPTPYMHVRTGILKENAVSLDLMLSVAIMGFVTLLAIGFAITISRRGITDKIIALRDAAQQVGKGNLQVRISDSVSGGELGELGRSFDEMSHQLAEDLEKRRQAEDSLRESEARFRILVETAYEGIWVADRKCRTTFVNNRMADLLGYSPEEMLGRTIDSFICTEQSENYSAQMGLREQGESSRFERCFIRKDGSRIHAIVSATPLFDSHSGYSGSFAMITDITDRKQAENALLESSTNLSATLDATADGILAVGADGKVLFANKRFSQLWDIARSTLDKGDDISLFDHVIQELADPERSVPRANHHQASGDISLDTIHFRDGRIIERYHFPLKMEGARSHGWVLSFRDISERQRAENELRRAKIDAEAASRAKSQFLSNMSHEIRTPLNGVIGLIELLLNSDLTAEQREHAELARLSGKDLAQLISDILDLSKIESHKIELEPQDFELTAMASDVIRLHTLRTEGKGLQLSLHIDRNVPLHLKGDVGRLRQVVNNLLGNAVKFTAKGYVRLEISKETEAGSMTTLRFVVRDSGIGIAADKLAMIFEQFTQADSSNSRSYGGSGLGLAIARNLTELMGGKIGVNSVEGEGATFWFTVVLEKLAEPDRHPDNAVKPANAPMQRKLVGSNIRILLVEDDTTNQVVTKTFLERYGYLVDVANNGSEAITSLENNDYTLVLMDCMMPIMNGYEATAIIRDPDSKVRNHGIPIIAITANAFKEDHGICLAAGMDDYLTKPVDVGKLLALLEKWSLRDSAGPAAEMLPG